MMVKLTEELEREWEWMTNRENRFKVVLLPLVHGGRPFAGCCFFVDSSGADDDDEEWVE